MCRIASGIPGMSGVILRGRGCHEHLAGPEEVPSNSVVIGISTPLAFGSQQWDIKTVLVLQMHCRGEQGHLFVSGHCSFSAFAFDWGCKVKYQIQMFQNGICHLSIASGMQTMIGQQRTFLSHQDDPFPFNLFIIVEETGRMTLLVIEKGLSAGLRWYHLCACQDPCGAQAQYMYTNMYFEFI